MTPMEAQVLQADDRRFDAMRKEDWAALVDVLADDLPYVHSSDLKTGDEWRLLAWQSTRQPEA